MIAVVLTTTSRRPGHGVGVMPIVCVPNSVLDLDIQPETHVGVTSQLLQSLGG
jgi:hypothetical protein